MTFYRTAQPAAQLSPSPAQLPSQTPLSESTRDLKGMAIAMMAITIVDVSMMAAIAVIVVVRMATTHVISMVVELV